MPYFCEKGISIKISHDIDSNHEASLRHNSSKNDSPFPELISRRLRCAMGKDLAVRRQYKVAVRPHNDVSYNCIKKAGRIASRHSIEYLSFNFIPSR